MNQTTHPTLPPTATAGIGFGSRKALSVSDGIPTSPRPIKALSVSDGIPAAPVSLPRDRDFSTCRLAAARSAFTLVELLVVIGIIATLAALVTPAVMRAQATARNAAIKAEIDMLHMAIMNYKNEYGSFPPCYDDNPTAPLNSSNQITSVAQKHLQRLFPRCTTVSGPTGQFQGTTALTPANAIIAWLSGFTDAPTSPLIPLGSRKRLYDYDRARLDSSGLIYHTTGKRGSPYIYISRSEYGNSWPNSDFTYNAGGNSYTIQAHSYFSQPQNGNYINAAPYANNETFQILCAGRDEVFGTDDDLSNFWRGTRRDYLDSLTQ